MARRDIYHDTVKRALQKDGWTITHDPFPYVLYRQILNEMGIERILYLAVSRPTFNSVFTIELGQVLLKNQIIRLIVFDEEREAIAQWIPD